MKRIGTAMVVMLLSGTAGTVLSAPRPVTLDVPGMTCSLCPITVRKALTKVAGVSGVDVSYEKKQAVVTFDDARTGTEALLKATRNAGYPATVQDQPR